MTVAPRPEYVRQLVVHTLQEFGVTLRGVSDLKETILIDEGRYLARSYRLQGLLAMWLVEIGIVQFYDAEGTMLRTINLHEESRPQSMVA